VRIVDTSLWIPALRRKGDSAKRARVAKLLEQGEAAWCPMIRLELWQGIGDERELETLRQYEQVIPEVAITQEVWESACEISHHLHKKGKIVPIPDILVFACARHHGVEIEHDDAHFDMLAQLT